MPDPTPEREPYGYHSQLVYKKTGEVVREVFDRKVKFEGPGKLAGFVWRFVALYTKD